MNDFQSVYWHSGLYLQPQHFQLTDLQHQYWNYRYSKLMTPFCWGMVCFELDSHALSNDELVATEAVMLFPDGAFVDCNVNGILTPRSLYGIWQYREKPMPLYIGVRQLQTTQANVSGTQTEQVETKEVRRWTLQGNAKSQRDLFGHGPDADIHTLRYDLRFFLHTELADTTGYTLLPAGTIGCINGKIMSDERVIVPSLSLSATPAIKNWVTQFCRSLMSKIRRLDALKMQGSSLTQCTPDEFRHLMTVLQVLCRYAAQFEYFRQTVRVHPASFWALLRQLNVELLLLSSVQNVQESSPLLTLLATEYDHAQSDIALNAVSDQFQQVMHQLLNISGSRISLYRDVPGTYLGSLENIAAASSASEIYLCLNSAFFSGVDERFIHQENIKLSASEQINKLINYSLPGIVLTYLNRLPHNLSVRDDSYCFRLDSNDRLWQNALAEKKITFYWTNAPDDLSVELIWIGGD